MGEETTVRQRLALEVTPELHARIRRLWIDHSKAEDQRDLAGKVTPARAFSTNFVRAFPDVRFDLRDIVIGPQGVIEIATMRGTQQSAWQGQAATGRRAELDIVIHFPWDPGTERFAGERIYYDSGTMARQLAGSPARSPTG